MGSSRRVAFLCHVAVVVASLGCRPPERVRYVYLSPPPPPRDSTRAAWSQPPVPSSRVEPGRLEGLVLDDETGQPLSHAQVQLVSTTFGAMTDSAGRFELPVPADTRSIRIRRIGYEPYRVDGVFAADSGYVIVAALRRSTVVLCRVVTGQGGGPESAVVISVRDAMTGRPFSGSVSVTVTDTSFRESFVTTVDSLGLVPRTIAPERYGSYTVNLSSDAYRDWQGSASTRMVPGCSGQIAPAVFRAWLVPR